MSPFESFDFDDDRMGIYRYVERHGSVQPSEAADHVAIDPEAFRHHVSMLKRDGYLEETEDGNLRVRLDCGETEEHETAGLAYEIRPACQADATGLLGVVRAVADRQVHLVAESVAEQLEYEDALLRNNAGETRVFFVATVEDEVVGWCQVEIPRLAKLSHTAELTVGVLVEYRRYSIGSHLLQRGMEWARANGCRRVYNSVPETNDLAVSFLQENGWRIEAVRDGHFEIDGDPVDEIMLAVDLD
ncbi:bifunctional helix-turn-helix transcriptional regulator/GNAT family N-acetyltransferase [Halorientalis halophila]|uniref:bifunctional helix-turn-helix transcriptional regulator/GNAT family N-acetyltransferase n=1 Tax=Halorientalis halophila TaxID=3108499 RepID=UPI00300B7298